MDTVNQRAHLAHVDEERLTLLRLVPAHEPQRRRDCHAIKEVRWHGNDALYFIIYGASIVLFAIGVAGMVRTVKKHSDAHGQ